MECAEGEREAKGYQEALELLEGAIDDGIEGRDCPLPPEHPAAGVLGRVWVGLGRVGERARAENADRERAAQRIREEIGFLQRRAGEIGARFRDLGVELEETPGSDAWWRGIEAAIGTLAAHRERMEEGKLETLRLTTSASAMLERLAETIREVGEGITETVEGNQHQIVALAAPMEGVERLGDRVNLLLDEVQGSRRGLEELIRQAAVQAHRSLGVADRAAEVQGLIEQVAEVAKKTNLLALNAAIEAAGAGEYGKGFAVVAKEIRNLAIRSAQTAETLGTTIGDMRKQSTMSVLTAEEEGKMARKAIDAFERYAPALAKLHGGLDEFRRLMDESRGVFRDGMRSGGMLGEKVTDAAAAAADLAERFRELAGGSRG